MNYQMKTFMKHAFKQGDRSFYHVHLDRLVTNIKTWKKYFPNITPYYAVKCNPNPHILNVMAFNGCSFDCASKGEIKVVEKLQSSFGTSPDIIFANPIKMPSHLKFSDKVGVNLMTCDSTDELTKIDKNCSNANVILRIAVDDSQSLCKFNKKFGMYPEKENLEKFFNKLDKLNNTNLVGISFHVGSGCKSSDSYQTAIEDARNCFDYAKSRGYKLKILNVGGGFILREPIFDNVAKAINKSIKEHFKDIDPICIAEPGRFLVENIADLYVKIVGKKKEHDVIKYFVNNSVYGDFNNKIFDYKTFEFDIIKKKSETIFTTQEDGIWEDKSNETRVSSRNSTIFGTTCDSLDCVVENIQLPELELGDFLKFRNMGAYTMAAASSFNGIPKPYIYYFGKDLLNLRKSGTLSDMIS